MAMELEESELLEPHPDIHALFSHYNSLYFDDSLGACVVSWSSSRMTRCAGICCYLEGGGCEIRLSEPLLKFRSTADLKNILLHEMIHAFLWIMSNNSDHSYHGPTFLAIMNSINSSSVTDPQRPCDGYNITIYHAFQKEVDNYRVHHWICESCGDLIKRAINREPSANDCVERMGHNESCNTLLCHWHSHKMRCSGRYTKIAEPPGYKDKRQAASKKTCGDNSEGSSYTARRTTQRLQKAEVKDKSDVKTLNTITKFFPSVGDAAASPGNASSPFSDSDLQKGVNYKQLKASELNTPEIPKRARTHGCRKKRGYSCMPKNRHIKRKREVTVAIAWLNYFVDEESEEEIEPLLNRRTERRKLKQQPLSDSLAAAAPHVDGSDDACSHQPGTSSNIGVWYTDNSLLRCKDGERERPRILEERRRDPSPEGWKEPSPSSSPQRDSVVYISDG